MFNNANFSDHSVQQALQFAQTPAGKRLIALLESQNKQDLQDAVSQAAAGNLEPIKKMLAVLQESREGKDLVDQFGRK